MMISMVVDVVLVILLLPLLIIINTSTVGISTVLAFIPNIQNHRYYYYHHHQRYLFSTGSNNEVVVNKDNIDSIDSSNTNTITDQWRRTDLFGTSIIDETIQQITTTSSSSSSTDGTINNEQQQQLTTNSKEERKKQRRSLQQANVPNFEQYISTYNTNNSNNHNNNLAGITNMDDTVIIDSVSSSSSSLPTIFPLTSFYRDPIHSSPITTLQINIGLYCNQACQHCHVESSPLRTKEMMSMEVLQQCLVLLQNTPSITTLDITGGAPELHEHYRTFVAMVRSIRPTQQELDIIDRCNLTVLQEPGQGQELINFFKEHSIHVIASLPCYSEQNVKEQRGNQVFERSIAALIALNDAGYGISHVDATTTGSTSDDVSEYKLDLVYNPNGAFLPPSQIKLQEQYKKELYSNFGIHFNDLYTITNMPIQRFADYLHRKNELINYMNLLVSNYNPSTIENVMCRNTISVKYDGTLYDCDFNQQLDIPILINNNSKALSSSSSTSSSSNDNDDDTVKLRRHLPMTIFDIQSLSELQYNKIRTDVHCFGCTAGMGSSCQGTTAA